MPLLPPFARHVRQLQEMLPIGTGDVFPSLDAFCEAPLRPENDFSMTHVGGMSRSWSTTNSEMQHDLKTIMFEFETRKQPEAGHFYTLASGAFRVPVQVGGGPKRLSLLQSVVAIARFPWSKTCLVVLQSMPAVQQRPS